MSKEERRQLIHQEQKEIVAQDGLSAGSKLKETLLIVAILLNLMLGLCVDSMPMAFFNYEAKKRGLIEYQTGIVMGCYDFGRLLAGPVCPLIIRRITVKKSMILGATICGTSSMIFGFIAYLKQPELLFVLFTLMRTVSGSGAMVLMVSGTSLVMQSKFYSNATMFSSIELAVGLGFILGGLIGGALIRSVGFIASFIVIGGVVCVSAIPCYFCVPNIVDVNIGGETKGLGAFVKLPGTIIILMVCSAANLGTLGVYNMTGAWVVETFGVPISEWSLYFTVAPVMYITGNIVASVTNRGYVYSTVFASAPGYILCFFFMCPSPIVKPLFNNKHYLPMTVTLFGLHSFLEPHLFVPLFQGLVNLAIANGHSADSMNMYTIISSAVNFSWALGAMLGAPMTGTITQFIGFPWATTVIAFLDTFTIVLLAAFLIIMKMTRRQLS